MSNAISALEDFGLPSVANAGAHGVKEAAIRERRREFDSLLPQALPRFRRMAMRWLRNPEDAEDAVQDAMLSAFIHIAQFDGRAQMSTWLTAIVYNAVRMHLRRRPRCQMLSLDQAPGESQWTTSEFLVDPRPTPERALEQSESHKLIVKLTASLPPTQRAALWLRQQNGLSIKKTAEMLRVSEGTLKAQLFRGRANLIARFHNAIGTRKLQAPITDSKPGRGASSPQYQRNRMQGLAQLPITVFREQGGCEGTAGV
jgi:RNA polymerase sigma-70 factor (ECF subfamily)